MRPWRTPYRNRDGLKAVDLTSPSSASRVTHQTHQALQALQRQLSSAMITDSELYRLAIVLGSAAMVLIILYHFFEVNANENEREAVNEKAQAKPAMTKTR
ncbi:hypothetical protein N0V88_000304 [Collariella sp. IMI 366227]|nr:hypothetical protein N0V88_000304 [Collariella sp. IMI 366227]